MILSKCDSLIGSHCGGTDIALELGKKFEYCEIFGNKEKPKINFEKYIRFFRRKMKLGEYSPLYRFHDLRHLSLNLINLAIQ